MKKIFKAIAAAAMAAIVAFPGSAVLAKEIMYVANVDNAVYLRTAPASDNYIITIPLGAEVESIGWQRGSDGEGYNQVVHQGMRGWIKTRYLSYSAPGYYRVSAPANVGYEVMYVANVANSVYLRTGPASDNYIMTIPLGAAVASIGWRRGSDGAGYNQVIYMGRTGWIKTQYLSY